MCIISGLHSHTKIYRTDINCFIYIIKLPICSCLKTYFFIKQTLDQLFSYYLIVLHYPIMRFTFFFRYYIFRMTRRGKLDQPSSAHRMPSSTPSVQLSHCFIVKGVEAEIMNLIHSSEQRREPDMARNNTT